MTIAMDRFGSQGQFPTYDPFSQVPQRVAMFTLQCRLCGFEPEVVDVAPRVCPKCHGQAWERFAKPGSLLVNAERY